MTLAKLIIGMIASLIIVSAVSSADARTIKKYRYTTSVDCLKYETRTVLRNMEHLFGKMIIVSTCRPGARIAGTRHMSKHAYGMAVDFKVPRGVDRRAVIRYLVNYDNVFVMTYRDMGHVHFNTGQNGSKFGAWSGRTRLSARHRRAKLAHAH